MDYWRRDDSESRLRGRSRCGRFGSGLRKDCRCNPVKKRLRGLGSQFHPLDEQMDEQIDVMVFAFVSPRQVGIASDLLQNRI